MGTKNTQMFLTVNRVYSKLSCLPFLWSKVDLVDFLWTHKSINLLLKSYSKYFNSPLLVADCILICYNGVVEKLNSHLILKVVHLELDVTSVSDLDAAHLLRTALVPEILL